MLKYIRMFILALFIIAPNWKKSPTVHLPQNTQTLEYNQILYGDKSELIAATCGDHG